MSIHSNTRDDTRSTVGMAAAGCWGGGAPAPSSSEPRREQASLLRQPFRPLRPGKTVPKGLPPFPLSVQEPHQLVLIVQQVFRKPSGRGTQTGPRVRVQSRETKEGKSREVWWAAVWPPARLSWALRPSFPQSALPCDNTSDLHGRSPPAPGVTEHPVRSQHVLPHVEECQVFGFYYDFRTSLAHL